MRTCKARTKRNAALSRRLRREFETPRCVRLQRRTQRDGGDAHTSHLCRHRHAVVDLAPCTNSTSERRQLIDRLISLTVSPDSQSPSCHPAVMSTAAVSASTLASDAAAPRAPRVKRVDEHGVEIKTSRGVLKPELISYFRSILAELEKDAFEDDEGAWLCVLNHDASRSAACMRRFAAIGI